MGLILSCLVAWFGLSFVRTDRPMQDYQAAAQYVSQHEGAEQPIFFFDNVGVLAFRHYYRGSNSMLGLPRDYTLDQWSNEIRALVDAAQIRSRIDSLVPPGGEFWIVERKQMGRFVRPEIMESFRKSEVESVDSLRVFGLGVYHLRRPAIRSDNEFTIKISD